MAKKGRKSVYAAQRLKRQAFLAAYAQLGNITSAAKAAGIDRTSHYLWLADKAYKKAFTDSDEQATERMEQEAWRRAVVGTDKPIYWKGVKVDTLKEYSDVLLIFLLKARRPDKYRERFEHGGDPDHTVSVKVYLPENNRDGTVPRGTERGP